MHALISLQARKASKVAAAACAGTASVPYAGRLREGEVVIQIAGTGKMAVAELQ